MLKTERNTPTMQKRVMRAARKVISERPLTADFEHGQWWVLAPLTGAAWSVIDCLPGQDGFDFEQVSVGEE